MRLLMRAAKANRIASASPHLSIRHHENRTCILAQQSQATEDSCYAFKMYVWHACSSFTLPCIPKWIPKLHSLAAFVIWFLELFSPLDFQWSVRFISSYSFLGFLPLKDKCQWKLSLGRIGNQGCQVSTAGDTPGATRKPAGGDGLRLLGSRNWPVGRGVRQTGERVLEAGTRGTIWDLLDKLAETEMRWQWDRFSRKQYTEL